MSLLDRNENYYTVSTICPINVPISLQGNTLKIPNVDKKPLDLHLLHKVSLLAYVPLLYAFLISFPLGNTFI